MRGVFWHGAFLKVYLQGSSPFKQSAVSILGEIIKIFDIEMIEI